MINSADPDQMPTDLDLHCLQRQGISGFSRTNYFNVTFFSLTFLGSISKIHVEPRSQISCYFFCILHEKTCSKVSVE